MMSDRDGSPRWSMVLLRCRAVMVLFGWSEAVCPVVVLMCRVWCDDGFPWLTSVVVKDMMTVMGWFSRVNGDGRGSVWWLLVAADETKGRWCDGMQPVVQYCRWHYGEWYDLVKKKGVGLKMVKDDSASAQSLSVDRSYGRLLPTLLPQ